MYRKHIINKVLFCRAMQIHLANKKQLFRTPFRTYLASVVTASKQQSVLMKTLLKVSIRRRSTSFTNA